MKGIKKDDSVEISETALLDFLKKSPLPGHRDPTVSATISIILVGISATMCHSAEKIPAKEECQYKRVRT